VREAQPILPKSAWQDSVNQPEAIPGHLPEVRRDRTEARGTPGSAQGVEWENKLKGTFFHETKEKFFRIARESRLRLISQTDSPATFADG
jgi:hypothetical protein